jgi:hypothetical protein
MVSTATGEERIVFLYCFSSENLRDRKNPIRDETPQMKNRT